jgi:hypothetical protein
MTKGIANTTLVAPLFLVLGLVTAVSSAYSRECVSVSPKPVTIHGILVEEKGMLNDVFDHKDKQIKYLAIRPGKYMCIKGYVISPEQSDELATIGGIMLMFPNKKSEIRARKHLNREIYLKGTLDDSPYRNNLTLVRFHVAGNAD